MNELVFDSQPITIQPNLQFSSYDSNVRKAYSHIVKNQKLPAEFEETFEALTQGLSDGQMMPCSDGFSPVYKANLKAWFLWRHHEVGREQAVKELSEYCTSDTIKLVATVWLFGVKPVQTFSLGDGIILQPIESMPASSEKEAFLRMKYGEYSGLYPYPIAALMKPVEVSKEENEKDESKYTAMEQLKDVALLMNALHGIYCGVAVELYKYPASVPLGPFASASGHGYSVIDLFPRGEALFESKHEAELAALIPKFDVLKGKNRFSMEGAIRRLAQVKYRSTFQDKFLDLGIALEMLLLNENNKDTPQLSLTFRLRGAWLLGSTPKDRLEISRKLRDIYVYRSKLAHNGQDKDLMTMVPTKREELLNSFLSLAEDIVQKLLMDGYPSDWNSLILGEDCKEGEAEIMIGMSKPNDKVN